MSNETRERTLESTVATIEKQFGPGSIMHLGSGRKPAVSEVQALSTGCLSLDLALGVGGVPRGRVIELFGPESSGKTTLTLQLIAECQKSGGIAAFIDAEHALDLRYAQALGVRAGELLLSQPDSAEQALEIVDILVRAGCVDLIIVDSVAALSPRAELDGEMGDAHMGLQARLMSQALRKLTANMAKFNTTVVFINQIRMKLGVTFGNPETTPGGTALKFFSSVRMEIRKTGPIKDGNVIVGNRTRVKVVKNKVASPFKETEFDILYGKGICGVGDVLDLATERGLVQKSGAWFSLEGERLGQGRENAVQTLKTRPELFAGLRDAVVAAEGLTSSSVLASPPVSGSASSLASSASLAA